MSEKVGHWGWRKSQNLALRWKHARCVPLTDSRQGRTGATRREWHQRGEGAQLQGLVGHCEDPGFYSMGNGFEKGDMISKILEIKLSNIFILRSSRKFYHTLRNVKIYNLRYLFRYINVSPKMP